MRDKIADVLALLMAGRSIPAQRFSSVMEAETVVVEDEADDVDYRPDQED
jgi:hypothetical protein